MGKFPVVGCRRLIKFFEKRGYRVSHKQGSHNIMVKDDPYKPLSIPGHRDKEVSIGVIMSNLKIAGISKEEFIREVAKK